MSQNRFVSNHKETIHYILNGAKSGIMMLMFIALIMILYYQHQKIAQLETIVDNEITNRQRLNEYVNEKIREQINLIDESLLEAQDFSHVLAKSEQTYDNRLLNMQQKIDQLEKQYQFYDQKVKPALDQCNEQLEIVADIIENL